MVNKQIGNEPKRFRFFYLLFEIVIIKKKKLTSCNSLSSISSPGIPEGVPAGPVLTNFSTVVVRAFECGDMDLSGDEVLKGDCRLISQIIYY